MYDIDDDPSNTFNFMVSEGPISDDDLDGFIRNISEMTELTKSVFLCIEGNLSNCPNSDGNEHKYLYQSFKCSYNYHMDDCNGIMTLGLVDVSYMSIFNDFVETDRDMFHGMIIDDFLWLQ